MDTEPGPSKKVFKMKLFFKLDYILFQDLMINLKKHRVGNSETPCNSFSEQGFVDIYLP